jgi:hypothetical protein
MLFDIMPVHNREITTWNICYAMPCGAAKTARLNVARVFAALRTLIVAEAIAYAP